MATLWTILVGWLPAWVQFLLLTLIALCVVVLLVRVIGAILDAIPFI